MFWSALERFEGLLKRCWTPEEGLLDAPEQAIRGLPRLWKLKMIVKGLEKAIFIGVSNGKHFWRMYYTKTLLLRFPRRKNSWYLQKNSWYLLKNQHLKVIYCKMHTDVISCRCLKAPWSVWKRFDALLEGLGRPFGDHKTSRNQSPKAQKWRFCVIHSWKINFGNNRLPKHTVVTSSRYLEELWNAFGGSWSHLEGLRKSSSTPWKGSKPVIHGWTDLWEFENYFCDGVACTFEGPLEQKHHLGRAGRGLARHWGV